MAVDLFAEFEGEGEQGGWWRLTWSVGLHCGDVLGPMAESLMFSMGSRLLGKVLRYICPGRAEDVRVEMSQKRRGSASCLTAQNPAYGKPVGSGTH